MSARRTLGRRAYRLTCLLALGGSAAHAQGPNRLWLGRVELEGPLSRVELDCGPDGTTAIDGPLVRGERQVLVVPLPWAPPLGFDGLAQHAPPVVRVAPENGGGRARWLGVVTGSPGAQPDERWTRLPVGLRVRPRPPTGASHPGAPAGASIGALLVAIAAALAAAGLLWREPPPRGRRAGAGLLLATLVSLGGGAAAFGLAARALAPRGAPAVLVDADLPAAGAPTVLRITAAAGEVALDARATSLRVETRPEGARLDYAVELAPERWSARAAGPAVDVLAFERVGPEAAAAPLAPAWWRDAAGAWTAFGAIEAADEEGRRAVSPGRPGSGSGRATPEPPGWLRAGLPPGRTALLGLLGASATVGEGTAGARPWLRATGAPAPDGRTDERGPPERD